MIKADNACKTHSVVAGTKYSVDDSCNGDDSEDNDDDVVSLGTQSPKSWMLVYR